MSRVQAPTACPASYFAGVTPRPGLDAAAIEDLRRRAAEIHAGLRSGEIAPHLPSFGSADPGPKPPTRPADRRRKKRGRIRRLEAAVAELAQMVAGLTAGGAPRA